MSLPTAEPPRISVIIEGYNDSLELGQAIDTLRSLSEQSADMSAVEVILTGSIDQARRWTTLLAMEQWPFASVRAIGEDKAHYYRLKNIGAEAAGGDILAFLDSDVVPCAGWLQIIETNFSRGVTATAGLSRFFDPTGRWPNLVLDAAAAISWGFIVGNTAKGMLNHNFAIRAACFRACSSFPEQYGRTLAGSFLFQKLVREGVTVSWVCDQAVAHRWSFGWWVTKLHARFGYEVYRMRRENRSDRFRKLRYLGPLEPLLTAGWHILLDLRNWLRIESRRRMPVWRQYGCLPIVLALSICARGGELAGMYATALFPSYMRRFAERN